MFRVEKTPFYSIDDNELLGFIASNGKTWQALTIFGYQISLHETQAEAETTLKEVGLTYLKGVWQYYDRDDHEWFSCVIKKAYEQKVIVNRTNSLGYRDKENNKQVTIDNPTEEKLIKAS